MSCELTNGRLLDPCLGDMAGVKTVFFFKHSDLVIEKNAGGEIIAIGSGTVWRFEQDIGHGLAEQTVNQNDVHCLSVHQIISFTTYTTEPSFLSTMNAIKRGEWAIFFMDYEGKIRLMNDTAPMKQTQGSDPSGQGAADNKNVLMTFEADAKTLAPFLEDFNTYPFDNIPGISVGPPYFDDENYAIILNDADDHVLLEDASTDILNYS